MQLSIMSIRGPAEVWGVGWGGAAWGETFLPCEAEAEEVPVAVVHAKPDQLKRIRKGLRNERDLFSEY